MKITPQQINSWLQHVPEHIRAVLFYGPNQGLVHIYSNNICKQWLGNAPTMFNFEQRSYGTMLQDPMVLASLVQSVPLGGGNICIRLSEANANAPSALQEVLATIPTGVLVIIEAGELPPSSSLRKYAEQAEHIAAIPCYIEEGAARSRHIERLLNEQLIRCEHTALNLLAEILPEDHLAIQAEISKLVTYLGEKRICSIEDIEAACAQTQITSLDDCAFAFLKQQPGEGLATMQRVFAEGHAPIALLRHLARKLYLLHELHSKIQEAGESEDKAMASVRPPIFFRQQPLIKQALRQWNKDKIGKTLCALQQLEQDCKYRGIAATQLCLSWLISFMHEPTRAS